MKQLIHVLIPLIIFITFAPANPVHADVAPPPPPYGADIYPNGISTAVRMVAETVDMSIIDKTSQDYPNGYAKVNATFHMQNLGQNPESMDVYFPMNIMKCDQEFFPSFEFRLYPSIRDFHATVNGVEKPVTTIYRKSEGDFGLPDLDIPCWAHFPATFPPGKEVTIQVSYIAPADVGRTDAGYESSYISYTYILHTGAGWKDTIGQADITIHMPYEINEINIPGYQPEQGKIQGKKISWRLKNFEPDRDISFSLLKPVIWKRILMESQIVKTNPNDGEAWGRLGKAYKEAFIYPKAYRDDQVGETIYQSSVEAYQKAVSLQPEDAAWHAGYAEILCHKTLWDGIFTLQDNPDVDFVPCVEQIKQALDLDPKQELANELLQSFATWESGLARHTLIDLSGPQPDYIALTPETPTKTATITFTPELPTSTPSPTSLPTIVPTSTSTKTVTPIAIALATGEPPTRVPDKTTRLEVCGSALIPGTLVIIVLLGRKRSGRSS